VPYTFGDSAIASERLALVAEIMQPAMDAALSHVADPATATHVLDLGCGPGHTTRRLAACFRDAVVVGLDLSLAYVDEAAARDDERCRFLRADVAQLPCRAGAFDVVYARYLLSHMPDVPGLVASWSRVVAPRGYIVLEEPEHIESNDRDFAEYERVSSDLVRASGAPFYAGPLIAACPTPAGFTRIHDAPRVLDPSVGEGASMFWRNARAWDRKAVVDAGIDPAAVDALATRLRAREHEETRGVFDWQQRQTVFRNRA
jgi:protein-L-isoaspartate O-methyltransferase